MAEGHDFRSPWLEQLAPRAPQPLAADAGADVVIVGAGIAGISTAFHVLSLTDATVLLIERDEVGRGATGRNAGQLVTYFERALSDLVDEFGFDPVIAAQREVDDAWDQLLDMVGAVGTVPVDSCLGHMGMRNLNHVLVHLRIQDIRRRGGLVCDGCVISKEAPFLHAIPEEYAGLYTLVPQYVIDALLNTDGDGFVAVLSGAKGTANGALLCQEVLAHLERDYPDRFLFVDHTSVERVVLHEDRAALIANGHEITAGRVVLCTNGFVDHVVENLTGPPISTMSRTTVHGTVGYMVGVVEHGLRQPGARSYIRNERIGDDLIPYVYVTARQFEENGRNVSLICAGGPEVPVPQGYESDGPLPAEVIAQFDSDVGHYAFPGRDPGNGYDYAWHGLMAYTPSQVRLVGADPTNAVLMYNLGCNGVGFLPSIAGGRRIARLIAGETLEPSIFDPEVTLR